jgi:hypothetical protein
MDDPLTLNDDSKSSSKPISLAVSQTEPKELAYDNSHQVTNNSDIDQFEDP